MRIKNNYNRKHIYFLTLHKILQNLKSRLWILVGVSLYGDTLDMNKLRKKYDQQKNHLSYQKLIQGRPEPAPGMITIMVFRKLNLGDTCLFSFTRVWN